MSRIEIEWISVHDIKPWDDNPRDNKTAIPVIAKSIEKNGWTSSILINQDNMICCGHTRWLAAKSLNILKIPCVRKIMTESEFREINIEDNKTGQIAKWDRPKLRHLMELMDAINNPPLGFCDAEVDKVFGHSHNETHSTNADFGDAGTMDDSLDENAIEKKMTFIFTGKEHRKVTNKLRAVKKEHDLATIAHALMKVLENVKGSAGPRLKKGGQ